MISDAVAYLERDVMPLLTTEKARSLVQQAITAERSRLATDRAVRMQTELGTVIQFGENLIGFVRDYAERERTGRPTRGVEGMVLAAVALEGAIKEAKAAVVAANDSLITDRAHDDT